MNGGRSLNSVIEPRVRIEESDFYKATGMWASAPARVALIRLLKEDVTARSLSKIWKDEMEFVEDHFTLRLDHWVPKVTGLVLVSLGVCLLAIFIVMHTSLPAAYLLTLVSVLLAVTFFILLAEFFIPYSIAARIEPMVEKVNAELPEILRLWKRGA